MISAAPNGYKVLQANLQRSKLATGELLIEASKRGCAVALLQEPYVGRERRMRGYQGVRIFQSADAGGGTVKAAIAVFDADINVTQYPQLTTQNIVVVGIQTHAWKITLVSLYFEPETPLGPYLERLRGIENELGPGGLIVAGDVNAWNIWWGSSRTDDRGEEVLGAFDQLGLQILNRGETPTFDVVRGHRRYTSCVDVTACAADMLAVVDDWRVLEDLTGSDHNGIEFKLRIEKQKGQNIKRTTRIFNTKKANWRQFHEKLSQFLTNRLKLEEIEIINCTSKLEQVISTYTQAIVESANNSIPKKRTKQKLTVPWWSEELAKLKKDVATKKRRIRCAAPVRRTAVVEEYLKQKKTYEQEVAKAQVESWKHFCEKQTTEGLWEGIYRVIGRTTRREEDLPLEKGGRILDAVGSAELLAETFYPRDRGSEDSEEQKLGRRMAEAVNGGDQEPSDPPFQPDELTRALRSFNPKKAPGPDGLTADICAQAVSNNSALFLGLLNRCLACHYFPRAWKEATVVILRKPGKDSYTAPKSYRPIGLLPVLGKVYEKMLVARLKFHILPRMSTRQYGFMPQRSTEDSLYDLIQHIRSKLDEKKLIVIVSLDIEGAFDSAWWPAIRLRLAEEKCPVNLRRVMDSYLSERSVAVRYLGVEHRRKTEKGCVQGSIGGPILWNLLLDPLLKSMEQREYRCQAFADDVVIIFDGDTATQIERQANDALEHVRAWGVRNKLRFAPHKTTAMTVTRKLKYDTPRLKMGGTDIKMSQEIKLLGLTIDSKLTFNTHVKNVCVKAVGVYKQLARAAKVSWGLHPDVIRSIYTAAVEPILLYAAAAWAPAADKRGVQKQFNTVQRSFAQKLCRAYRTVSLNSALVLAGVLPLDIRIREASTLYKAKRGVHLSVLGDREMERMAPAIESPHPSEQYELELGRLVDEEQYQSHSDYAVRIFTDGSKIEGKVGAAYSVWNQDRETKARKLTLPSYCTVYQAELLALKEAVEEVLKGKNTAHAIYSDSMAALQTVANHGALHPLAVATRDALRRCADRGKCVSLFWIKAHAGLEGNERADVLAKEAALRSKRKPDYDRCPMSFAKKMIRLESLGEWNHRYRTGTTASTTKLFFPDAVDAYKTIRGLTMSKELTQALTGHGGFSEYLARFKCKESPSCVCDDDVQESLPHLLLECPQHERARNALEIKMDQKVLRDELPNLIRDKKCRTDFINFLTMVVRFANARNSPRDGRNEALRRAQRSDRSSNQQTLEDR